MKQRERERGGGVAPMGGDALSRLEINTTTNHHINVVRNANAAAVARDIVGVFVPMGGDALSRNLSLKQK